jgi:hypothetical protein
VATKMKAHMLTNQQLAPLSADYDELLAVALWARRAHRWLWKRARHSFGCSSTDANHPKHPACDCGLWKLLEDSTYAHN